MFIRTSGAYFNDIREISIVSVSKRVAFCFILLKVIYNNFDRLYTGIAWKHHIATDFESGQCPSTPNGAKQGSTIFLDYEKMVEYLAKDGREWYICELQLNDTLISFDFGCDWMATIHIDLLSEKGFVPFSYLEK